MPAINPLCSNACGSPNTPTPNILLKKLTNAADELPARLISTIEKSEKLLLVLRANLVTRIYAAEQFGVFQLCAHLDRRVVAVLHYCVENPFKKRGNPDDTQAICQCRFWEFMMGSYPKIIQTMKLVTHTCESNVWSNAAKNQSFFTITTVLHRI